MLEMISQYGIIQTVSCDNMINIKSILSILLRTTNPILHNGSESTGPITMSGNGLVYIELQPDLDYATLIATGKPTQVTRGVYNGFSLPLYAANEELFFTICIPSRWDGISDIKAHADCWLSLAEDTRNFNLQLNRMHYTPNSDIVPNTLHDVEVQTATGVSAAQYQSYRPDFTIYYNVDTPDDVVSEDILGLRLRRIAVTEGVECAGEIVINHLGVSFRRNKMGSAVP